MSNEPVTPRAGGHPRNVRLVQLPTPAIHALACGDLTEANRVLAALGTSEHGRFVLTPFFVAAHDVSVWRIRSRQLTQDPASAGWITRAIWDADSRTTVGRAGYHGPPDAAGMVEVGYAVDPDRRRRGYARAALEALLTRAATQPAVRVVRATISPQNAASRLLVQQYGFVEVGEQMDEEDGLEIIFEVPASRASRASRATEPSGEPGV